MSEKRIAKEIKRAIRNLSINKRKSKSRKSAVRCVGWTSDLCSGHMTIKKHSGKCALHDGYKECDCHISNKVWVWAHCLPVFVQCDSCGYAPSIEKQAIILGHLLTKQ